MRRLHKLTTITQLSLSLRHVANNSTSSAIHVVSAPSGPCVAAVGARGATFIGEGDSVDSILKRRVADSRDLRRRHCALPAPNRDTAYRLIHGSSDGVPQCTVDVFGQLADVRWSDSTMQSLLGPSLETALRQVDFNVASTEAEAAGSAVSFFEAGVGFTGCRGHDTAQRAARRVLLEVASSLPNPNGSKHALTVAPAKSACNGAAALLLAAVGGCNVTHITTQGNADAVAANMHAAGIAADTLNLSLCAEATYLRPDHLQQLLGSRRQFSIVYIEWDGALGEATTVETLRAIAARVVVGGFVAVWLPRVTPIQSHRLLRRIQADLTTARGGAAARLRLVTELHPGADFSTVVAHPLSPRKIDLEDPASIATLLRADGDPIGGVTGAASGFLFHVE